MDSNEGMDRELIVERAEELRGWLSELSLSSLSVESLERELAGIIANDPGGYINGHRPLAGLTINDFVAELSRPTGGVVARVRGLGVESLAELRAVILDEPPPAAVEPEPPVAAAVEAPPSPPDLPPTSAEESPEPEPLPAEESREPEPLLAEESPEPEPLPAEESPDDPLAAEVAPTLALSAPPELTSEEDAALQQLVRLWPSLHPQARRAVVLYTSMLLIEAYPEEE